MYNNIPTTNNFSAQVIDSAYQMPLELETNTFNLMKGFFESKGFDKTASESIAVTFIRQATFDGYNPLTVLDTIKKFDPVQLNALITEVLNFSRYKTSYLGSHVNLIPLPQISRNIVI